MFPPKRIIIFFFLITATAAAVAAKCRAESPTLSFGGVSDIRPLAFETDATVKGFLPEIFLEIAHRAGFHATLRLIPFKRLYMYLQKGEMDGTFSVFHKKERENYLIYSTSPVLISRTRVFFKKGREFPIRSASDLFGRRVGLIAGWSLNNAELEHAIREGKITTDTTTRCEENLKKLIGERFDCLIATEQLTWYYADRLGLADRISVSDTVVGENRTFIAISRHSKNIPDPRKFMKKLDAAINSVLSDGTQERLQKKYSVKTLKDGSP